jgi:hypothetical protein
VEKRRSGEAGNPHGRSIMRPPAIHPGFVAFVGISGAFSCRTEIAASRRSSIYLQPRLTAYSKYNHLNERYKYAWMMQHRPQRSSATPPQRPKRQRAAQACDRCRLKKYKCDELYPCTHCKSKLVTYTGFNMIRGLITCRKPSRLRLSEELPAARKRPVSQVCFNSSLFPDR